MLHINNQYIFKLLYVGEKRNNCNPNEQTKELSKYWQGTRQFLFKNNCLPIYKGFRIAADSQMLVLLICLTATVDLKPKHWFTWIIKRGNSHVKYNSFFISHSSNTYVTVQITLHWNDVKAHVFLFLFHPNTTSV